MLFPWSRPNAVATSSPYFLPSGVAAAAAAALSAAATGSSAATLRELPDTTTAAKPMARHRLALIRAHTPRRALRDTPPPVRRTPRISCERAVLAEGRARRLPAPRPVGPERGRSSAAT